MECGSLYEKQRSDPDFIQVARKGVEIAEQRPNVGEASQVEVLQARSQVQQAELFAQHTEARYRGAWLDLMAVAGAPDIVPLDVPVVAPAPPGLTSNRRILSSSSRFARA